MVPGVSTGRGHDEEQHLPKIEAVGDAADETQGSKLEKATWKVGGVEHRASDDGCEKERRQDEARLRGVQTRQEPAEEDEEQHWPESEPFFAARSKAR